VLLREMEMLKPNINDDDVLAVLLAAVIHVCK
jgi:hypothetical protein